MWTHLITELQEKKPQKCRLFSNFYFVLHIVLFAVNRSAFD